MSAPVEVLHVVDRVTGGVPVAVAAYIRNSPEGFRHSVLAPSADGGARPWDDLQVTVHDMGPTGAVRRIRRVRDVVRSRRPDVLHAHSSFAGAYTRLAVRRSRRRIVYSPHCYAFERTDLGAPARSAFRALELLLGFNTTAVAACSPIEAATAHAMRSTRGRAHVVPNVALVAPGAQTPWEGESLRVGMLGRVSAQKGPDFFAELVARLRAGHAEVEAVWIGDGQENSALEAAGVRVTGWLPRDAVRGELDAIDVYLHSAAWEGFPIAVLDAHASGLPILVRGVPTLRDVPSACTTAEGMGPLVASLRDAASFARWSETNRAAWEDHLRGNTTAEQQRALGRVWSVA